MNSSNSSSRNWVGIGAVVKWGENCKPVLHPMTDLDKEIEINGEKFTPNKKLNELNLPTYTVGLGWSYRGFAFISIRSIDSYKKMIEWHFDVEWLSSEGLIEQGLAIDINTL